MELDLIVDLFVRAYAHLQSQTTQGELRWIGGLPCVHFGRELAASDIRDEIVVYGMDVAEAALRLHGSAPSLPHWLTVFTPDPKQTIETGQQLGYKLEETEFVMARELETTDFSECDPRIAWATQPKELEALNRERGAYVFHPSQLVDSDVQIAYLALNGRPASWGAYYQVDDRHVYISNMFTCPDRRRQGLGSLVLSALLQRAVQRGAQRTFLISTQAGYRLYHGLGYQTLIDSVVLKWPAD